MPKESAVHEASRCNPTLTESANHAWIDSARTSFSPPPTLCIYKPHIVQGPSFMHLQSAIRSSSFKSQPATDWSLWLAFYEWNCINSITDRQRFWEICLYSDMHVCCCYLSFNPRPPPLRRRYSSLEQSPRCPSAYWNNRISLFEIMACMHSTPVPSIQSSISRLPLENATDRSMDLVWSGQYVLILAHSLELHGTEKSPLLQSPLHTTQ